MKEPRIAVVPGPGSDATEALQGSQRSALAYTTRDYIRLITGETRSAPYWLEAWGGDVLRAAMPLVVKTGPLGPVVNSLAYYGSNGGVIGGDDQDKRALLAAFDAFCRDLGAVASTIITNPLLQDQGVYEAHAAHALRDERIGQITFFPPDRTPESLLALFDDPRPRNIRKAEREGVTVRTDTAPDAMAFVRRVHQDNIGAIGGLSKNASFFDAVAEVLAPSAWTIYVASKDGEDVAALLLLRANETVEYYTPCIVEAHRSTQALPLLVYRAMCDAMAAGFAAWNWGGTWLTQDGVYGFKKRWGTTDLRYHYFTQVYDPAVLDATRADLLRWYPGFYVVPFSALGRTSDRAGTT